MTARPAIAFMRLTEVPLATLVAHMTDPRMVEHLPLLAEPWDESVAARFVAGKQARWRRDGLGHWAILANGGYVGWGGFEKEGETRDFGLVLRADAFGFGPAIVRKALAFARADPRVARVTFLLAPSRRSHGALNRLGARPLGLVEHGGAQFLKYGLDAA